MEENQMWQNLYTECTPAQWMQVLYGPQQSTSHFASSNSSSRSSRGSSSSGAALIQYKQFFILH